MLFITLNLLDILLTLLVGLEYEINPIVKHIISNYGILGLFLIKLLMLGIYLDMKVLMSRLDVPLRVLWDIVGNSLYGAIVLWNLINCVALWI